MKVLIIGSGPIVIGQAAEFDYAGTQACRSLREEGIQTVLVNSNPATIMTDPDVADTVYIEPLTRQFLEKVIARERPDGLLPTLGGQTGLNLALELAESGVLDRYNVRLLGTSLDTIRKAEDRDLFKRLLIEIGEPVPESVTVSNVDDAIEFVDRIGLPVIVRPAFTLGGTGGGIARTPAQLRPSVQVGLDASPIHQVLVEKYLHGWKELEYEVMRDAGDTCITICNMENIDPMGVHTGDSIVVAPSQTLTDKEHQMLRSAALRIIRALRIEGGCNVQFALDPNSFQYYVIEVNPRVSRSSALASKATGYPIARVAAKIAIGKRLHEIPNAVTRETTAAFEPALDYCVVKIPRWPFDKFPGGDRTIGTQMKATGEVMAIDRTFEAAFQKAVRCLEVGGKSLLWRDSAWDLRKMLIEPSDLRLWAVFAALREGWSHEEVHELSGIDHWFLSRFAGIIASEQEVVNGGSLSTAKQRGLSDATIGELLGKSAQSVREERKAASLAPTYKMVDTCAAEFEARTPYFYSSYDLENEAPALPGPKAVVLGSGPIRIGQGIEFDYCSVHSAWALKDAGYRSIMLNSNPETVSTDFDTSDRLYFEALDPEAVLDVLENESAGGDQPLVVCQFGGQTAINLAETVERGGYEIAGSDVLAIDLAEDREKFNALLNSLDIPQPPGAMTTTVQSAVDTADRIGYPVLVRPSYVLGGRAMEIVYNSTELRQYLTLAIAVSPSRPVLVDKYMEGIEVEVDCICDGRQVLIPGIMEHIERAGVHSGDSMAAYPPLNLTSDHIEQLVDFSTRMSLALNIRGLLNIQYVVVDDRVLVIEANPRSSRTVPFLSKVTGVPMVRLGTLVALGKTLDELGWPAGLLPAKNLYAVKAPVFSMAKLLGVDAYLGPEMKSTGEVMGIDRDIQGAIAKAFRASGIDIPERGCILASIADKDKDESLDLLTRLSEMGYRLLATSGTARFLENHGVPVERVNRLGEGSPDIIDAIGAGQVQAVINTTHGGGALKDGFEIRRAAVEVRIPCLTSLDTARALVTSLEHTTIADLQVSPLLDYVNA
ncbi:MAG: carbamoyl-phosphate synthase large subunit [Chloroflexi bacterium]|nr:carbamoyl-phosphate synthase large subunit [Chloroflexota bacterium]